MRHQGWAMLMVVAVLTAAPAAAGTIDRRQHRQRARVDAGVRSGELTQFEASRLRAEQAALRGEERLYRRTGGGLAAWERRDLRRDLNRTSRDIRRQKNDG